MALRFSSVLLCGDCNDGKWDLGLDDNDGYDGDDDADDDDDGNGRILSRSDPDCCSSCPSPVSDFTQPTHALLRHVSTARSSVLEYFCQSVTQPSLFWVQLPSAVLYSELTQLYSPEIRKI